MIIGTQEAEIRRTTVQGQPRHQKQDHISKIPNFKKAGTMAKWLSSSITEFKP
jgi:hypothetical protein